MIPVKLTWLSKTQWFNVLSLAAAILAAVGDVPWVQDNVKVSAWIVAGTYIVNLVLRQWFTASKLSFTSTSPIVVSAVPPVPEDKPNDNHHSATILQ